MSPMSPSVTSENLRESLRSVVAFRSGYCGEVSERDLSGVARKYEPPGMNFEMTSSAEVGTCRRVRRTGRRCARARPRIGIHGAPDEQTGLKKASRESFFAPFDGLLAVLVSFDRRDEGMRI